MTSTTMELADEYGNQRMTDGHHDLTEDHPHTLKARDALEARVKELERDAARYRAIRDGLEVSPAHEGAAGIVVSLVDDFGGETLRNEDADAAIDRAMSEAALTKMTKISQEYKLP